jgi:hypothetical protein
MVSGHDPGGARAEIVHAMSRTDKIYCGGQALHNDDDLAIVFNNDKIAYIRQSKFNICPENEDSEGYVTEKIFDAISAGCVPVYFGSGNNPEPDILNHESIIFWKRGGGNSNDAVLKLIEDLHNSPKLMKAFAEQPRFREGAADVIIDMLDQLYLRLHTLLTI